jgi:histidinol phosphatase-like PHP family hydrolase
MAKQRGMKVVISTDAHNTTHFRFMKYGVITAALRPKPSAAVAKPKAAKTKSA